MAATAAKVERTIEELLIGALVGFKQLRVGIWQTELEMSPGYHQIPRINFGTEDDFLRTTASWSHRDHKGESPPKVSLQLQELGSDEKVSVEFVWTWVYGRSFWTVSGTGMPGTFTGTGQFGFDDYQVIDAKFENFERADSLQIDRRTLIRPKPHAAD